MASYNYHTVASYAQAAQLLGDKPSRNLPSIRNTSVIRRWEGKIAIRYHYTDVVTYYPDGSVQLQSDGWQSATTKARINTYSPVSVYQTKGLWYVVLGRNWDAPMPFYDGMIFTAAELARPTAE